MSPKKAVVAQRERTVAKAASKSSLKKQIVNPKVQIKEKPRSKADLKADALLGGRTQRVVRDASSGKLVGKQQAKLNPTGTTTEVVKLPPGDPTKIKVPKKLNECVDLYEAARRERLAIQKSAEGYAELEGRLREHLIDNVSKGDASGVTGKTHRVTVKVKSVPRIGDEAAFLKAAHKKGNEDLVKQVPNMKAIEERWEAGKVVPGVESFNIVSLSLNKL